MVLKDGDTNQGIALIQHALRLNPALVSARHNLGCAYFKQERFAEAIALFQEALALKADLPATHYNLGNALVSVGREREAVPHYNEAYRLKPDYFEALGLYVHFSSVTCAWHDGVARSALLRSAKTHLYAGPPFVLHALVDDPAAHLSAARQYSVRNTIKPSPASSRRAPAHARLRLAYVSRDFRRSAVAHLLAGLLEDHDRTRFEVHAISYGPDDGSSLRQRIVAGVDAFLDVRHLSDAEVAAQIQALEIDIAIDLNGHTQGNRIGIFMHRPAPLQVTYLGFSGTTGSDAFDYAIVDPIIVPSAQQQNYTEALWHLPGCFLPNDRHRVAPGRVRRRTDYGLPPEGLVFCCFNNAYKITPEIFDIWMRLLNVIPGSVLWLALHNQEAVAHLSRAAQARGIDPQRLIFAPKVASMSDHLARYLCADLFLDTFPYSAATTASDALWSGLPLLSLSGQSYASRMASSILHAVGLDEMVTTTFGAYETTALALATQPQRLASLKAKLARNLKTHPLFDSDQHRRYIESAFVEMAELRLTE